MMMLLLMMMIDDDDDEDTTSEYDSMWLSPASFFLSLPRFLFLSLSLSIAPDFM